MPEKDILEMLWTAQEVAHGAGKILQRPGAEGSACEPKEKRRTL
jgi:hypothetical protein